MNARTEQPSNRGRAARVYVLVTVCTGFTNIFGRNNYVPVLPADRDPPVVRQRHQQFHWQDV